MAIGTTASSDIAIEREEADGGTASGWLTLDNVSKRFGQHVDRTNRRVYIEYVMLAGVNDAPEQATALGKLLGRDHFKVNLIPYNPTGMYDGSSRDAIARFKSVLDRALLPATVRLTRGRDIAAACGQLAAQV